jgi:bla regulator protein BlaR1
MVFSVINPTLTDHMISALCNTLVHSLWQGLLLSAIGGIIVLATRRASAALRYNLLIGALLLFVIGSGITFSIQLNQSIVNYSKLSVQPAAATVAAPLVSNTAVNAGGVSNITASVLGYLNQYHNTIVLIWFLIICAKCMQLGVGLFGTFRLRSVNVIAPGHHWEQQMQQLAAQLGITQTISLLQSGLAKVPMVIGNLKPVILIPMGLLTALSAEEVEAILVHELAHIKRRDYLVNLLQSLVEIVFFFNPAVLWISQLIKTERENCCDDLALGHSNNKVNYIRALVSCEEYQSAIPAYAMAFPGSKNKLIDRVKRLANNRNHSLNLLERTLLAVCLVISGVCMSAFAARDNIKRTVNAVTRVFEHNVIAKDQQAVVIKQTQVVQKQITNVVQATKQVVSATPAVQPAVDSNKLKLNTQPTNLNMSLSPMNVKLSSLNVSLGKLNINDTINVTTNDTNKKIRVKIEDSIKTKVRTSVHYYYSNSSGGDSSRSHNRSYSYSKSYPSGSVSYSYSSDSTAPKAPRMPRTPRMPRPPRIPRPSTAPKAPTMPGAPTPPAVQTPPAPKMPTAPTMPTAPKMPTPPVLPPIGDDLLKAGLIKDKNNFTVKLNDDELVVNGVKQSEENHQLFLKKYTKKAGEKMNMNFSYHNSSTKK